MSAIQCGRGNARECGRGIDGVCAVAIAEERTGFNQEAIVLGDDRDFGTSGARGSAIRGGAVRAPVASLAAPHAVAAGKGMWGLSGPTAWGVTVWCP